MDELDAISILTSLNAYRVVKYIYQSGEGGVRWSDLEALNIPSSLILYTLKKLLSQGLITKKGRYYHLSDPGFIDEIAEFFTSIEEGYIAIDAEKLGVQTLFPPIFKVAEASLNLRNIKLRLDRDLQRECRGAFMKMTPITPEEVDKYIERLDKVFKPYQIAENSFIFPIEPPIEHPPSPPDELTDLFSQEGVIAASAHSQYLEPNWQAYLYTAYAYLDYRDHTSNSRVLIKKLGEPRRVDLKKLGGTLFKMEVGCIHHILREYREGGKDIGKLIFIGNRDLDRIWRIGGDISGELSSMLRLFKKHNILLSTISLPDYTYDISNYLEVIGAEYPYTTDRIFLIHILDDLSRTPIYLVYNHNNRDADYTTYRFYIKIHNNIFKVEFLLHGEPIHDDILETADNLHNLIIEQSIKGDGAPFISRYVYSLSMGYYSYKMKNRFGKYFQI